MQAATIAGKGRLSHQQNCLQAAPGVKEHSLPSYHRGWGGLLSALAVSESSMFLHVSPKKLRGAAKLEWWNLFFFLIFLEYQWCPILDEQTSDYISPGKVTPRARKYTHLHAHWNCDCPTPKDSPL